MSAIGQTLCRVRTQVALLVFLVSPPCTSCLASSVCFSLLSGTVLRRRGSAGRIPTLAPLQRGRKYYGRREDNRVWQEQDRQTSRIPYCAFIWRGRERHSWRTEARSHQEAMGCLSVSRGRPSLPRVCLGIGKGVAVGLRASENIREGERRLVTRRGPAECWFR